MQFIRDRALQDDPEEEAVYEETPSKRQCSAYLRAADLPREIFQHNHPLPVSYLLKYDVENGEVRASYSAVFLQQAFGPCCYLC